MLAKLNLWTQKLQDQWVYITRDQKIRVELVADS